MDPELMEEATKKQLDMREDSTRLFGKLTSYRVFLKAEG